MRTNKVNNISKIFIGTALLLLKTASFSQKIIIFNPSPDFFILQQGITNAAAYENEALFSSLSYKNRIGPLSDIRDIYFDLSIPLNENQKGGLKIYSEQETSLFTKNKVALFYSYSIQVNPSTNWTLAAEGGLANINFSSGGANIAGSAFAPDLSLSSLLEIKTIRFGLSIKQLTHSSLKPINYSFVLNRYLETYLVSTHSINTDWSLNAGANLICYADFYIWDTNAKISYKKNIGVLVRYGQKNNYAIGAFSNLADLLDYHIQLALSYSNAYYPGIPNSNTVSVFLSVSK